MTNRRGSVAARPVLAATIAAAFLLTAGGAAAGASGFGKKLDHGVAAAAAGGGSVRVLVTGDPSALDRHPFLALHRHFASVDAVAATLDAAQLADLATDPGVAAVLPDAPLVPTAGPTFSATDLLTLHPRVDRVGGAWSAGLTGAGVAVAVIDSGVTTLPDLEGRLVPIDLGYGSDDTVGHGTFVAGVLAGASSDRRFVGVARGRRSTASTSAVPITTWNTPAITTTIACRWLEDGTVSRLEARKRDDARTRQALARDALAGLTQIGHPSSYFVWLPLPEDARADRVAASLARQHVSVSTAEPYATCTPVPQAIRLALGSADLGSLREALGEVRRTIEADAFR